jgi:phage I-like protein
MPTETISLNREMDGLPAEIQIIPYGYHETGKGAFRLDDEGMRAIIEEFDSRKNDMVIDYEHQSLSGGEAPAAGWIKRLVNKGMDGLWAVVQWNERAREYLKNREYRYLSPVLLKRASDSRVLRLINAALTNQPAIDGMVPLVNRTLTPPDLPVVNGATGKEENRMEKLLSLLGLPEEATDDEALEALTSMKEELFALKTMGKEVLGLLGLEHSAAPAEVSAAAEALRERAARAMELEQAVLSLNEKLSKREADNLVLEAMKQGKVTPAQRQWAASYAERDPEGFKVFAAQAPRVIFTDEVAGFRAAGSSRTAEVEEVQACVNRALGIDVAAFSKHNKEKS